MNENDSFYDRLRYIQINLKKENSFYTFFRTEARELNHKIKLLYLSNLYQQKKLGMIHMEAVLNKDITSRPLYVSSFYAQDPIRIPKATSNVNESLISQIESEVSKLSSDDSHLLKCCQRIYKMKDEIFFNILALSTIPSIFGNLLFKESVDRFLTFMRLVIKEHYHLAIILAEALYIHPLFVDFIIEVMSDLDVNSEKYFHKFQKNWKKNAKYCPLAVIEMISYAEDPSDFLYRSLFEHISKSIRSTNSIPLVPNMEIPSFEKISKGFKKISGTLWTHLINEKDNSTLLPSSQQIEHYIPDFDRSLLLSPFDIDVILNMRTSSHEVSRHFQSYCFSAFLFTMPKLQSYYFTDPNFMEGVLFQDNIEGKLREILLNIDNIFVFKSLKIKPERPIITPICLASDFILNQTPINSKKKETQLYQFLEDQIAFMPNKAILKRKLDNLKPLIEEEILKSSDKKKNEIEIFNDILQSAFDDREIERQMCYSDISYMNQIIFSLENLNKQILEEVKSQKNVLTFYLIEKWSHTFTPPNNSSPEEWNKLYTDDQLFQDFFQSCFDHCQKWCLENKYMLSKSDILECLFNNVMLFFNFKKFLNLSEDLQKKDEENSKKIDDALKKGTIEFIPMAEKLIGDNLPKKLKPILKELKNIDKTDQPLVKIEIFLQAQSMLFNLLQFVGVTEVGADQLEPCLFMLFSMANLPHLESTMNYIDHFISPLRSFVNFPLALPFDRIKTSIMGFLQLIDEKSTSNGEEKNE